MNKKEKGFSLLEIIIIGFIVISLAVMILGLFSRSKEISKSMICLNNLKQISMAIENYQADWKSSPNQIYALFPDYVKEKYIFKCPNDKNLTEVDLPSKNSYGNFYVNRSFNDEDTGKIYLFCPRHFNGTKGIGAFLSYSANIMANNPVTRNNIKIMPGDVNTGGTYRFVDGTTVVADSTVKVGLCGSFITPDNKNYSVIFVPEESVGSLTVTHSGDSRFEVVTPALIAGVSGTKFTVSNAYDSTSNQSTTTVSVNNGVVNCEDRSDGVKISVSSGENLSLTVLCPSVTTDGSNKTKSVPLKPLKRIKIKIF